MKKIKKLLVGRLIFIASVLLVILGIVKLRLEFYPKETTLVNGWNLILVNRYNYIPENYEVELVELSNGKQVDERIYEPLLEMFAVAEEEGVYMVVVEAYRTDVEQQEIMDNQIETYLQRGYPEFIAEKYAEKWVAKPGTSEHQLGIAVDINPDYSKSDRNQVYTWLAENAHKYGFIYRYPEEKVHITGIGNEPWHYRYVGVDAAEEMHEKDVCLEEYVYSQPLQTSIHSE